MGFIQEPSLRIVDRGADKPANIVSASYDFSTDTPQAMTFIPGRQQIDGTFFTVDLTSLGRPRSLPAVRSMQFVAQFDTSDVPFVDGALLIYVPATGELLEFAPSVLITDAPPPPSSFVNFVITAVVPLVCAAPTKIQVIKGMGSAAPPPIGAHLRGNIVLNLYDFDRAPYVSNGFYNNFLAG